MPLYMDYCYYSGGLGDFMRSALAFYSFAKANCHPFYLNITSHPIGIYFKNNLRDLQNYDITYNDVSGRTSLGLNSFLERIRNDQSFNIRIISNICDFLDINVLKANTSEFLKMLELTSEAEAHISKLLDIKDGQILPAYTSLHLRCGDHYMSHNDNRFHTDNRLSNCDVSSKLSVLTSNYPKPVIFHCDSQKVKDDVCDRCGFLTLKLDIGHTAHQVTQSQHLDALAEFFIIGRANQVVMYTPSGWLSGFSYWSAILHGKTPIIIR